MTPTPEMVAMAERIAASAGQVTPKAHARAKRVALAAIIETTEKAAAAIESLCFFIDIGEHLEMTKQEMSARTCREGAKVIRNGEHLK